MSQNDFNLANQGFPSMRSDMNSAFQALATNSSGPSEPSTTYAYQWWYDETNDILKIRNSANDDWIDFATFDQTTESWSFASVTVDGDLTVDTDTLYVDSENNRVGIGTSSPNKPLHISGDSSAGNVSLEIENRDSSSASSRAVLMLTTGLNSAYVEAENGSGGDGFLAFGNEGSEAMRIDSSGNVGIGTTDSLPSANNVTGTSIRSEGGLQTSRESVPLSVNRKGSDGQLQQFRQDASVEGTISVSGTTVSYNGGHLARWSRLADGTDDTHIYKGTVMTNLNEMCEWRDEQGDLEDNEQLNKTTVSTQEGDPNVAGLFVAWDEDDDWGDYYLAMTGDLVIRIAEGVTVKRGDLMMSAGDGTAKPQDDDIVRSKTIAKVTSNHTSHTYPDGSYAVPCVVMAC